MKQYHQIMYFLFPPKCALCGGILKEEELDLCKMCRIKAPVYQKRKNGRQFLDSFTAVWYYEGYVRKSLLRYKFGGARYYAESYGRLLAMKLIQEGPQDIDVLTWIPVSPIRKLRRGYDQGELLAKAVGKELGMVPVPLLKKVRHNPAQSGIQDTDSRRKNVQGVYRIRSGISIKGQRVLLLDDILTTGATAAEAARVLRAAGAKEVHCAAVAASRKGDSCENTGCI